MSPNKNCLPIADETKRLARWLFRMVDKRDWGYLDQGCGRPKFAHTASELQGGPRVRQAMNRQLIQVHRDGRDRIYCTSRRNSGFCLAMIDVDQHAGQTDGLDLTLFLVRAYFPGAYWEPSRRGFHLYVPFRCQYVRRTTMNDLLLRLRDGLRLIAQAHGFSATLDVTGGFNGLHVDKATGEETYRHGTLAVIPRPPTTAALNQLTLAPIHFVGTIFAICDEAQAYAECQGEQHNGRKRLEGEYASGGTPENRLFYEDGFTSMHRVAQLFCRLHRRAPDGPALLEAYCQAFGKTDNNPERRDLADRIASYYRASHNPDALAGFAYNRPRLLALIGERVTDWTLSPAVARKIRKPTPDDLAVVLYVVELVSFTRCEQPALQFGMPRARLLAMFATLAERGVIAKPRTEGKEIRAILDLLTRARVVECLDRNYQFNSGNGIGQKWHIAQAHPRYAEFLQFSDPLPVRFVGTAAVELEMESVAA